MTDNKHSTDELISNPHAQIEDVTRRRYALLRNIDDPKEHRRLLTDMAKTATDRQRMLIDKESNDSVAALAAALVQAAKLVPPPRRIENGEGRTVKVVASLDRINNEIVDATEMEGMDVELNYDDLINK